MCLIEYPLKINFLLLPDNTLLFAIAIALIGFNDLGRSVAPTFLFKNRFDLQLSTHVKK